MERRGERRECSPTQCGVPSYERLAPLNHLRVVCCVPSVLAVVVCAPTEGMKRLPKGVRTTVCSAMCATVLYVLLRTCSFRTKKEKWEADRLAVTWLCDDWVTPEVDITQIGEAFESSHMLHVADAVVPLGMEMRREGEGGERTEA